MAKVMRSFWKLLRGLIAPSALIEKPELRRRATLLNTLLLIYLLSTVAMIALILLSVSQGERYFPPQVVAVTGGSAILFALFFLLAKTRYYIAAGICFCLTIDAGLMGSAVLNPAPDTLPGLVPFFIVPVLIAMFVLPLRSVIVLGGVSLVCAFYVAGLSSERSLPVTTSFWFLLIVLALIIAGSFLRTFDIKQMEDERLQLFHAARMSTLGEMAGGIAHEVNNPVAVIQLRASQALRFLQQKPDDITKLTEFLEAIKRTASHIEKVVRGLRSFSRSGLSDPFEKVSVKTIIEDTLGLCEEQLRHAHVELQVDAFDKSLAVECRAIQISQILLNLISNARAAVEALPERWIRIAVEDRGERLIVSVTDSGRGISSTVAKKVFEPFYTTKREELGTGIGLSISQNLAKHHGGSLFIDRESPHTRFVLELPKVQALTKGNR